jgi:FlaA1/EpsC-like NDP-sugar epimerase
LRPGEKLDEELFFADEVRTPTTDERVTCAMRPERSLAEVRGWLDELRKAAGRGPAAARETLMRIAAAACGASDRAVDPVPASGRPSGREELAATAVDAKLPRRARGDA